MSRRLLHVFPSFGIGGIPVQFAHVASGLGRAYHHLVLPLDGRDECRRKLAADVSYEILPRPEPRGMLARLVAIARTLRAARPDMVVTYNWGAIEWCFVNRLLGIAAGLHCEHGFGVEEASRPIARRVALRRLALGSTVPVVVPSQALVELARTVWKLPPGQVTYLPNGVDAAAMRARAAASERPGAMTPEAIWLGTVAPLRPEKNVGRLVRIFRAAAPHDPRLRLAIVGDGVDRAPIEAALRESGLADRAILFGTLADPSPVLAHLDVFALTSETEQMPFGVLEAMAIGLPVLSTDVGDVKRMVAAENAPFVRDRADEAALAEALRALAADRDLRRRIGEANHRRCIEAYPLDGMVAMFKRIYDGELHRRRA